MESHENSEQLGENSKKTRVLGPKFLQNTELFLECVSMLLPGVADRSEFISAAVTHVHCGKTCFCHVQLVFVIVNQKHFTPWQKEHR